MGSGPTQTLPSGANALVLADNFFSQGGFSNFSIKGTAGVEIVAGTIAPVLTEEVANAGGLQLNVNRVSSSLLPLYPAAPVNLAFSAPGTTGGVVATLALDSGASIRTGPTGSVGLTGQLVAILGDVSAPGGTISVTGDSTGDLIGQLNFGSPDVSVYLGPGATLSTSGEEITTPTPANYQVYNTGEGPGRRRDYPHRQHRERPHRLPCRRMEPRVRSTFPLRKPHPVCKPPPSSVR